MTDTFDRTQLDGKDRGQLSEIAAALGVKAVSRMRKAELVDAIVTAAKGGGDAGTNGADTSRPRKIRSTVTGGDDLASLAAEENALAADDGPQDDMVIRRRPTPTSESDAAATAAAAPVATIAPAPETEPSGGDNQSREDHGRDDHGRAEGGGSAQQLRDDDGQGNRRRRRRRGRDRDRPNGAGGAPESRESREEFSGELLTLKMRYKKPDGDTSKLLEFPLNENGKKFSNASTDFRFATAVGGPPPLIIPPGKHGRPIAAPSFAASWPCPGFPSSGKGLISRRTLRGRWSGRPGRRVGHSLASVARNQARFAGSQARVGGEETDVAAE